MADCPQTTLPKIGKREMEALAECADYVGRGSHYWWRKASMAKLAAHGLVTVQHNKLCSDSWVPSEAGWQALRSAKELAHAG